MRTASETFAANRAVGAVEFDVQFSDGRTRRGKLDESGSLRVRFPSPESDGLSAVFVNTAGGVAGGDRFDVRIAVGPKSRLIATTATAEKVYRSHDSNAQLNIAFRVEDGAHLAWLPQETILFDQARVERRIDIDLAETGSLLLCEIVVFGRAAMGERMTRGYFSDRWRLRCGSKLVFAENVRLDGNIAAKLAHRAIANGGTAIGTALIAPGDQALVEHVREIAGQLAVEVGISAWNGFAMVRFCAQDAARLRSDMMTVLERVGRAPLPRLWLQ